MTLTQIFCDASYNNSIHKLGIGIHIKTPDSKPNTLEAFEVVNLPTTTHAKNRLATIGEIIAVTKALIIAPQNKPIELFIDNDFLVDFINEGKVLNPMLTDQYFFENLRRLNDALKKHKGVSAIWANDKEHTPNRNLRRNMRKVHNKSRKASTIGDITSIKAAQIDYATLE